MEIKVALFSESFGRITEWASLSVVDTFHRRLTIDFSDEVVVSGLRAKYYGVLRDGWRSARLFPITVPVAISENSRPIQLTIDDPEWLRGA